MQGKGTGARRIDAVKAEGLSKGGGSVEQGIKPGGLKDNRIVCLMF